jgi:hypothetical protein
MQYQFLSYYNENGLIVLPGASKSNPLNSLAPPSLVPGTGT